MTEHSLRRLTKAHIIELRTTMKPHHLVEKILKMVCIIRGCIAPNWRQAQEMMNDMTFRMELRLTDPIKIKQSIIKKVLKILNANPNLTPDNVIKYSEGAAILLTWIINLIKWNAGHNRFTFDEATLAGGRLMNKELIAQKDMDEEGDDPFKRINAYGLMKKKEGEDNNFSIPQDEEFDSAKGKYYYDKSLGEISDQKSLKAKRNKSLVDNKKKNKARKKAGSKNNKDDQPGNRGKYLESKQMVFTDLQMLIPSTKSNEIQRGYIDSTDKYRNESGINELKPTLQGQMSEDHQSQGATISKDPERLFDQDEIRRAMEDIDQDKKELLEKLSQSDEDILQYLNTTMLENEPTEVLIKCAEILRERRQKLYPEQTHKEGEGTSNS